MGVEVGDEQPFAGEPGREAAQNAEFVAHVMQPVHARDQVEAAVGDPLGRRAADQAQQSGEGFGAKWSTRSSPMIST